MLATIYTACRSNYLSVLLFLSVGLFTAVINFSSFAFFYKIAGLNYQLAVSIAYVLALLVHFSCNRSITFKKHDNPLPSQLVRYSFMVAINYCVTLITVRFVVENLHLSPFIGLIAAISITIGSGYVLSRFWVFKLSTPKSD
jgi:putative flippase GtrA